MKTFDFYQKKGLVTFALLFLILGSALAQNGNSDEMENSVLRSIDDPALQCQGIILPGRANV